VAIASSGDELRSVNAQTTEGQLIDTNSPVLGLAVRRVGGIVTQLGLSPDRLEVMTANFAKGLTHDVLLTVSGASVGERDFTQDALRALGVEVEFWKVAMKPGKPLLVGRKGSTLVFGLPGNPVSALVSFELFVRPALRVMQGLRASSGTLCARLDGSVTKTTGIRLFARAVAELRGGTWWATPLSSQSSGALASASGATHLISVAPSVTSLAYGDQIDLIPLAWSGAD
jgi:molybdopterin molybdotransferase